MVTGGRQRYRLREFHLLGGAGPGGRHQHPASSPPQRARWPASTQAYDRVVYGECSLHAGVTAPCVQMIAGSGEALLTPGLGVTLAVVVVKHDRAGESRRGSIIA